MELLLNRRTVRGVTRYLARWRGHTSADDEWLRLEELAHCPERKAEYDAAAPLHRAAPRVGPAAAPAPAPAAPPPVPPPLVGPAGFLLTAPSEVVTGPALAGRCCSTGRTTAGFVGRRRGVVVPRGTRMSAGTTGGRRWALLLLIRSSMPLRTAGRWARLCPVR